jgi:hypothetical protein
MSESPQEAAYKEYRRMAAEQARKNLYKEISETGKVVIPPNNFENIPEPIEFAEGTSPGIDLNEIKLKSTDEGQADDIREVLKGLRKAEVIAKEKNIMAQKAQKIREEKTGIMELSQADLLPVTKADREQLEQEEFDSLMLLDDVSVKPPKFNVPGKGQVTLPKRKV